MSETSTVEFGPRAFPLINALRPDLNKGELVFVEKDTTYIEPLGSKLQDEGIKGRVVSGDAEDIDFKKEGIPPANTIFCQRFIWTIR